MNKSYLQTVIKFAAENSLSVDYTSGVIYGSYRNYNITVMQLGSTNALQISLAVKQNEKQPDALLMKQIASGSKKVLAAAVTAGYRVRFNVKPAATLKGTVNKKLLTALDAVTAGLAANGYINCCQNCGENECDACCVYNDTAFLCDKCYEECTVSADSKRQANDVKKENIVGGIVGALLGSLIGVAAIVVIMHLGYVAAVSGIIMGVCALKGYELLGGKLSNTGIIITSVLMFIMVFAANHIYLSMYAAKQFECGFFDGFSFINYLLKTGEIAISDYIVDLIPLYLFTALGAIPTVINSVKSRKNLYTVYKLGKAEIKEPVTAVDEQ